MLNSVLDELRRLFKLLFCCIEIVEQKSLTENLEQTIVQKYLFRNIVLFSLKNKRQHENAD